MKVDNSVKIVHRQGYTSSTSGTREHFVCDIVKNNDLRLGAEIGVRTGRTSFHLLDKNLNLTMYCIDIDIKQFHNESVQQKYGDRIKVFEVDSRASPDFVEDGTLDFYFIDASHTYKNVVKDIVAWTPKLKPGGWMIGHDINYPSVDRAIKDTIGFYEVGPDNVWFARNDKNYTGLIKL
jgi:predicted O-methyltransferase YrrM